MPKSTSILPILNWFEEPIRQSVHSVFNDLNNATEALDIFKKYRNKHFHSLKVQVQNIKILGMTHPVPLIEIYSPAFVSTTIHGRLYEENWHSLRDQNAGNIAQARKSKNIVEADQFIESHKRVVILGGAGSGKTTLLRYLALAYADRTIFDSSKLNASKFPIFVSMLAYCQRKNTSDGLFDYVIRELEAKTDKYASNFVKRVLEKGVGVLLLDGLDEVPSAMRSEVINEIKAICERFPEASAVVSCRTADYIAILEDFYEVELAKLSRQAVDRIIEAWFKSDSIKIKRLKTHLRRDGGLQSLTETPLLLSLLCIQFRHDLSLPKRKTELYKRCVDAFLREWDASRGFRRDSAYASLSDDRKERIFEHVAGLSFATQIHYTFREKDLIKTIAECCQRFSIPKADGKTVLDEIERHHGILERFSTDTFMFSHPSFQEYFAARYFLSKRKELDYIKKNFEDDRWATVIEFIVSMHDDPAPILRFLKEQSKMTSLKNYPAMARRTRNLWLLYRCMNTGAALDPTVRTEMFSHLVDSQIQMSEIYVNGGVFPVAVLVPDGVRHSYVYFHKRPTLYKALQPLRLLANEILLSPSEDYANNVVRSLEGLKTPQTSSESISYWGLILCLVVPISSVNPVAVDTWLLKASQDKEHRFFGQFANESRKVLSSFQSR